MNKIIKIGQEEIGGEGVNTISARDLHSALESKQDFSSWMKIQVERARLSENRDFVLLTKKGEQTGRGIGSRGSVFATNLSRKTAPHGLRTVRSTARLVWGWESPCKRFPC